MTNTRPADDVLAGNWAIDGNDELVALTDEMFSRGDDTDEAEARTLAGLAETEQADKIYRERLADLRRATGLTQAEVANQMGSTRFTRLGVLGLVLSMRLVGVLGIGI